MKKVKVISIPRKFNPHKLLKRQMIWLMEHSCKHHHTYMEHPSCYFEEKPDMDEPIIEHTGYLDIETSNFNADFGYVFCYSIATDNATIISNLVTPKEIRSGKFDKRLVSDVIKDIRKFHRIIVYWGKDRRHDVPFLRSRALRWGLSFPEYKELVVTDAYDVVKAKLNLHRNRLVDAARFLEVPAKEHPLIPDKWMKAQTGDKEALEWIQIHCDEDVIALKAVWTELEKFVRKSKLSI